MAVGVHVSSFWCVGGADRMHGRARGVERRLLGDDDYEVALSIGHLASLYNYDMGRYSEAEKLYLKSIDIGTLSLTV